MIPVIDLRGGEALHARAGRREDYLPVRGRLGRGEDALALARAFQERLGLHEIYVADLDAIAGGSADLSYIRALAELGIMTRIDAGIKTADDRRGLEGAGATDVIAATETLSGVSALSEIARAGPVDRLIFSLDLREGRALVARCSDWPSSEPIDLVRAAADLGIDRFLLLETARMGTGVGFGQDALIDAIRERFPSAEINVGGGVSGIEEIQALVERGVSRVLVGSALHDGRIDREALKSLRIVESC